MCVCVCVCVCVMCVLDSPFSLSLFGQHSALSWCVVSHVVFLFLFVLLLFINAACTYSVEALRLQRTCRLYTTSSLFLLLSLSLSDNISFLLCLSQNTHLLKFSVSLPNLCTPAFLSRSLFLYIRICLSSPSPLILSISRSLLSLSTCSLSLFFSPSPPPSGLPGSNVLHPRGDRGVASQSSGEASWVSQSHVQLCPIQSPLSNRSPAREPQPSAFIPSPEISSIWL